MKNTVGTRWLLSLILPFSSASRQPGGLFLLCLRFKKESINCNKVEAAMDVPAKKKEIV